MSHEVTTPPRILSAFVKAIIPAGPSTLIARQMHRAWRRMRTMNESASHTRKAELLDGVVSSRVEPHGYARRSVEVDGLSLNYVCAGNGRPVVLIHGNPGS